MDTRKPVPIVARLLMVETNVEFPLNERVVTIGRLLDVCEVVVERNTVSRIHAEIKRSGSHFVLSNLSRNGTFVDGVRIEGEHTLQHGEKIGLASPTPVVVFMDDDPTFIPIELLRYDDKLIRFFLNDRPLDLAPSEFHLLQHLYRNKNQVCTRESCAEAIWGRDYLPGMETGNLDKVFTSLRKKFKSIGVETELIKNRRGHGFMLDVSGLET